MIKLLNLYLIRFSDWYLHEPNPYAFVRINNDDVAWNFPSDRYMQNSESWIYDEFFSFEIWIIMVFLMITITEKDL